MVMDEDKSIAREKKLGFLWKAAHLYAIKCPSLSTHLMQKFSRVGSGVLPEKVNECFCPSCHSLFSPYTSTSHSITRRKLKALRQQAQRRGRDIEWLHQHKNSGEERRKRRNGRRFLLIRCQVCQKSYATVTNPPQKTISHAPEALPATPLQSHRTPLHTPSLQKTRPKSSRRHSSTLKSLLQEKSRLELQRAQQLTASPAQLRDFLLH